MCISKGVDDCASGRDCRWKATRLAGCFRQRQSGASRIVALQLRKNPEKLWGCWPVHRSQGQGGLFILDVDKRLGLLQVACARGATALMVRRRSLSTKRPTLPSFIFCASQKSSGTDVSRVWPWRRPLVMATRSLWGQHGRHLWVRISRLKGWQVFSR